MYLHSTFELNTSVGMDLVRMSLTVNRHKYLINYLLPLLPDYATLNLGFDKESNSKVILLPVINHFMRCH